MKPADETVLRTDEPGWDRIGTSVGRRSLWLRVNPKPDVADEDGAFFIKKNDIESFELCAGREGDDGYVKIEPSNPQFWELLDVLTTAKFAVEAESTSPSAAPEPPGTSR
jgi:hypothetical protein